MQSRQGEYAKVMTPLIAFTPRSIVDGALMVGAHQLQNH